MWLSRFLEVVFGVALSWTHVLFFWGRIFLVVQTNNTGYCNAAQREREMRYCLILLVLTMINDHRGHIAIMKYREPSSKCLLSSSFLSCSLLVPSNIIKMSWRLCWASNFNCFNDVYCMRLYCVELKSTINGRSITFGGICQEKNSAFP